ncbi:13569_t:CDS:2, partial [Entrophospora sp. SA101]
PPASTESAKSVNDQSQFKNSDSGASESVPTEPISWTTIIVLSSIGGLIVVAVILFAFVRRKRRREMANNIVATSSVAWEQQNNAYEKMEEDDEPTSLGSFTVVASYTPSLDDELEIQPGDKVTILVEYDDGWVNGINESRGGIKGMFPRHCVDMNSVLNNKRSSSMAYTMSYIDIYKNL